MTDEKCKNDPEIDDLNDEEFDIDKMQDDNDEEELSTAIDTDTTPIYNLPKGLTNGHCIINHRTIPTTGFTELQIENSFSSEDITRLKLKPDDVSLPIALALIFPEQFASHTRARKE